MASLKRMIENRYNWHMHFPYQNVAITGLKIIFFFYLFIALFSMCFVVIRQIVREKNFFAEIPLLAYLLLFIFSFAAIVSGSLLLYAQDPETYIVPIITFVGWTLFLLFIVASVLMQYWLFRRFSKKYLEKFFQVYPKRK
jgi:hypothetical protein